MNTSNGGAVARCADFLLVADLVNYQGTYVLDGSGEVVRKLQGIMWFAAVSDNSLFFSDQRNHDFMTHVNMSTLKETCVMETPCANLICHGDRLFFINEAEKTLCECGMGHFRSSALIREKVFSFVVVEENCYYVSDRGLGCVSLAGRHAEILAECAPVSLHVCGDKLYFADRDQNFTLCVFDMYKKSLSTVPQIQTQSIAGDEDYLYVMNLFDNKSIVRLDMRSGESIRFCGDKADRLHMFDDCLIFQNQGQQNNWYRVLLLGGRSIPLLPSEIQEDGRR